MQKISIGTRGARHCLHVDMHTADPRRQRQSPAKCSRFMAASAVSNESDRVLIAGAGIAGLATAAALQKVDIPAVVLERESGPRLQGSAIGLWPNAFRSLDALGPDVAQHLRDAHPLIQRVQLSRPSGDILRQFSLDECTGSGEFRGVLRSSLLQALSSGLAPGTIRYDTPIESVHESPSGPSVVLRSGETLRGRVIVGADGNRSKVADALNLGTPSYAGYSAYRGVATYNGPLPVAMDTVRQSLGRGVRAGMYVLSKNSLYWFIAMNCPEDSAPPEGQYKQDALSLVKGWSAGISEAVENTPDDGITRNRVTDRWLLPGKPIGRGTITLAGDSAHPMTPNLGQGGCCALEDAIVLAQELRDAQSTSGRSFGELPEEAIAEALRKYEKRRSLRVTKITVRSNLMGRILGSGNPAVCSARDLVIEKILPIKSFMDHTMYDPGYL